MEDTIQKFVKLPAHIRTAVSSPEAIRRLEKIEAAHNVKLANLVMRVATKEVPVSTVASVLEHQLGLSSDAAKVAQKDLVHNIFSQIANYLGFRPEAIESAYTQTMAHEGSLGVDARDAEIEHHSSKLKFQEGAKTYDAIAFADTLLSGGQFTFDHVLQKRFEKLIQSRLADVREKADVLDRLTRDSKVGGLGLTQSQANSIVDRVETEYQRIHALNLKVATDEPLAKVAPAKSTAAPARPMHPPIQKPIPPAVPQVPKPAPQPIPKPTEPEKPEPPKPSLRPDSRPIPAEPVQQPAPVPPQHIPSPVVAPKPVPAEPREQIPEPMPVPKKRADVPHFMPKVLRDEGRANRPTMSDIKAPSKLVGPVEELRNMTVKDFRRLGETLEESVSRIKEMVRKLEKESFERRSEGLKAWRSSELVKQYLEIGRESMEKNLNVNRIIADKQSRGEDVMTADEFDEIASLNRSLRY